MRTRYGLSPWIDQLPATRRDSHPRLRGEHTAQVAIVGGGLTGCATAHACAMAGLPAVLLEGDRIGQGSSGRGGGLLLPEPGPAFRDVTGRHGLRASRGIFEAWRRASLDAAALLRRLGIPCGLEACDALTVARGADWKAFGRELDARRSAGLDVRAATRAQIQAVAALDAAAGRRMSGAFAFDPYRACLGLARAARSRGGTFFERTPVKRVRASRRYVDVVVDGGFVRAQTVIVCTGSATAEFKPLRRHFKARERYYVLTAPMPASMRRHVGNRNVTLADDADPPHRISWTRDGRALVSGADGDATPSRQLDGVRVQRTGQLMYEFLVMYPAISGLQPAYGWESAYGRTADGLPYIGPHRNYPRHLFALGGDDSATRSFLAARLLARAVAGAPDKADQLFGWTR